MVCDSDKVKVGHDGMEIVGMIKEGRWGVLANVARAEGAGLMAQMSVEGTYGRDHDGQTVSLVWLG
jgi:hypothetical protein